MTASHRTRASLLWGVVGALSFLVLAVGFELAGVLSVSATLLLVVSLVVLAVATVLSHAVGGYLERKRSI